ncbi:tRNA (Guanosine18-2'-O-) -methyltransferase [Klebsiella pneumoniae]|uniref:tRNA (Guanosine18-2'-O-) -methyltransferase n=1 Tax=Klebsiella pneumoniae TaxID=573 RepID=A0A447RV11_KLEPN|nr:tRNA (Guanosine18-2'-O-) -methyltransferase [Klebsiella pneumoniae]
MGQEKTGITPGSAGAGRSGHHYPDDRHGAVAERLPSPRPLILYEAQRQRQNAGMYQRANSMLPPQEQQRLLFEGGYPVLARVARQKGLPYPHVNEQGEVEADAAWWATMQAAR